MLAILARRGAPVDVARGAMRESLDHNPATRDLVRCLVEPYADLLVTEPGRSYVRIVAQLRGRFAAWRVDSDTTTTVHLAGILDELEVRPHLEAALRRERVLALIMLLTASVAERARRLDDGIEPSLDHRTFVANLVDMCSAVITG